MAIRPMISKMMVILLILMTFSIWVSDNEARGKSSPKIHARHIILFIGDGMHLEHEFPASRYLYGKDYHLVFHRFPYQTDVSTWDVTAYNRYGGGRIYDPLNIIPTIGYDPKRGGKKPYPLQKNGIDDRYFLNPVISTDSASAATAISTLYKTEDGNIAWLPGDPQDGALKTIAEIMREEKGISIGVVSTVPFSHATPASFVSHNKNRNCYYLKEGCERGIADEIIKELKPDVVIGGGHPSWLVSNVYDLFPP